MYKQRKGYFDEQRKDYYLLVYKKGFKGVYEKAKSSNEWKLLVDHSMCLKHEGCRLEIEVDRVAVDTKETAW